MGRHGNQNPPRQIRIIENRLIGHHPATGQVWSQVVGHPELVDVLEWTISDRSAIRWPVPQTEYTPWRFARFLMASSGFMSGNASTGMTYGL